MKLSCLVLDDEPYARQGLAEYIRDIDFLELAAEAEHPVEAIEIIRNKKIDILFLDINMPRMNGIDFLRITDNLPTTIITTANPEYSLDGYELKVIDYLLKPIAFERFLAACKKAQQYIELSTKGEKKEEYFFVKSDGVYEQVIIKDIIAIESLQNYVKINTKKSTITAYLTLKIIEDYLPEEDFIKIHKSFVVNKNAIQSITQEAVIINDKIFPIGQTFKSALFKTFLNSKLIKR